MAVHVEELTAGLSSAEAAARLARDGPNVLPPPPRPSPWRELVHQMTHFFAAMLWVAGVLAIIADMPQLGAAIFVVIVVNGLFAFVQEARAERAAEHLRALLPRRATVLRDGERVDVDASELVVGDLVLLEGGDRVSADAEIVDASALAVDTSTMTGESVPAQPGAGDALYAGTFVVEGEGRAVVTATGVGTRLAAIAQLTQTGRRPKSPLALELNRVVRMVAAIAVGVGVSFFAISLLIGTSATDGFLFAIGVTVALVPEGLLPTVTLSLAIGAQRMAARNALVRRLESVETLGSTTFICTDKTGTLTENRMSAVEAWTPAGTVRIEGSGYGPDARLTGEPAALLALGDLAVAAARCSSGRAVLDGDEWIARGDPMEAALDALARRCGRDVDADAAASPDVARFPFDPRRRRMSVVAGGRLLVKGAPAAVVPRCSGPRQSDKALASMAARGRRVLAVAERRWTDHDDLADEPDAFERGLTLLGLVGLEDPPRPHARDAIEACRRAGVRVAMITGDDPRTGLAIAREVGLVGRDRLVLEGSELPEDEALLGAMLDRDGVVVGRVDPEDKLRIAQALQARGHVVAMTGDGVNDGPALRKADIGVAMGRSGTDVAREAADLVLLDDDFATIVAAVAHGRATFANVRRFLTYHLTDNVAELTPFVVWALSGGRFPLALGVLQILCLDIGTDLLPALALGAEPASPGVLDRRPHARHLLDRSVLARVFGVLGPTEAFVEMTAFVVAFLVSGWRPGQDFPTGHVLEAASGAAFAAVVLGQLGNALACRSRRLPVWRMPWRGSGRNPLLLGALAVELGALGVFLYAGPVADVLDQTGPPLAAGLVAIAAAPLVILADAAAKAWTARRA